MASESSGFHSDQSSHFSGRPAPPYHLFDVTREYLTGNVAVARRPPRIKVVDDAEGQATDKASTSGPGSEDEECIILRRGTANREHLALEASSAHDEDMLSPATEAGRMMRPVRTAGQQIIASDISISEDGGCLVAPSSASSHRGPKTDQLSVAPSSDKIRKMKAVSWQDLSSQTTGVVAQGPSEAPESVMTPSIAPPPSVYEIVSPAQIPERIGLMRARTSPFDGQILRRYTGNMNYEEYASRVRQRERMRNLIRGSQEIIVERYFNPWRLSFMALKKKALSHGT